MSDEIEDALRRELQGQWVPFDEARAEDMVRAAADAGLADTPRAWVAPVAAAAAVVVIGGGVALATARGGGNSNGAQPGGGGGASSGSNAYATGPCTAVGSDDAVIGTAYPASYPASAAPGDSGLVSAPTIYTAINEGSSAPDAPPVSASETPVKLPPLSAGTITGIPAPTVSYVPMDPGSSGIPEVGRSGEIYICEVGPASGTVRIGQCTTRRNSAICTGSESCSTLPSSTDAPGPDVICIATDVGTDVPPLPTESPSGGSVLQPIIESGSPSGSTGPGPVSFTVQADVQPGQPGGKAYVPDFPQGYQLEITGWTLRNPAGDAGTLTIGKGDTKLLHQNLADIRNIDQRFSDQPVVFTPGTPFVLGVNCANTNGDCTPAVDVTGQLVRA